MARERMVRGLMAVVGLAAVTFGAVAAPTPAAATTVGIELTDGSWELYDEFAGLVDGGAANGGVSCAAAAGSLTTAGNSSTGTISLGHSSDRTHRTTGGTNFRVVQTTSLSGTYSGGAVSASGSMTLTAVRTTGLWSCTAASGAGTCTISHTNITASGSISAATPASPVAGDAITISGGNYTYDTVVTGSTSDCADLIAVHNGSMTLTGVTYVVPGVAVSVTGGSVELYDEFATLYDSVTLGSLGSCRPAAGYLLTRSGALAARLTSDRPYRAPDGTDFRVVQTTQWSGSYSGSSASATGSTTVRLARTTGFGSCAPTAGGVCTIEIANVAVAGSFVAANPGSLVVGDSLTVSGGNAAYEVAVTGTSSDCAGMVVMSNGFVGLASVVLQV